MPFVIWTEGIAPQVYDKYVSTMDIAPTVVDLFSLDADLRYYIGNDMFGPDGGVVYFRNYAWYDGKTYDTGNDASSNPAVLAMREQVREQLTVIEEQLSGLSEEEARKTTLAADKAWCDVQLRVAKAA